jgi:uncharacterized protein YbbC (DUF1343 family)
VLNRNEFEPVIAGVAMVKLAFDMYPNEFRWKEPPYEYVYDRNPFDVIAGTSSLRESFERGDSLKAIEAQWQGPLAGFRKVREQYLLY